MTFRNTSFLTESFERVINNFYAEAENTSNTGSASVENSTEIRAAAQDIIQHFLKNEVAFPSKSDRETATSGASSEDESCDEGASLLPKVKLAGSSKVRERMATPVIVRQPTSSFPPEVGQPKVNEYEDRPQVEQLGASQTEETRVGSPQPAVTPIVPQQLETESLQAKRLAVRSPQSKGLAVKSPQPTKLAVGSPQTAGLAVGSPQTAGLAVRSPQTAGLAVRSPQTAGLVVGSPQTAGLVVGSPQPEGLAVGSPQRKGLAVGSPQTAGLVVRSPQPEGLAVGSPQRKGLAVKSPQRTKLAIGSPQREGVPVESPQPERLAVGSSPDAKLDEVGWHDVDEKKANQNPPETAEACDITRVFAETDLDARNARHNVYFRTRNPSHTFDFEWCLMNFSTYMQNVRSPVFCSGGCPTAWQASISLDRSEGYLDLYVEMLSNCEDNVRGCFIIGIHNTKGGIYLKSATNAIFNEKQRKHLCFKTTIPPLKSSFKYIEPFEVCDDELIIKGRITCTGCCISTVRVDEPKLKS